MSNQKIDFDKLADMDTTSLGLLYCRYFRDVFGFPPEPSLIAATKEGLIKQFRQAERIVEHDERFKAIVKNMLSNMKNDVKKFANESAHHGDVSDHGGMIGYLLAGAGVRGSEIKQFASDFENQFESVDRNPQPGKSRSRTP